MATDFVAIRDEVVAYLRNELIGPREGDTERLTEEPYRRYLAGTLYPRDSSTTEIADDEEEDIAGVSGADEKNGSSRGNQADDPIALASQYLPSSLGIGFFLRDDPRVSVIVRAARYSKIGGSGGGTNDRRPEWQRVPLLAPAPGAELIFTPAADSHQAELSIFDGTARLKLIWRAGANGWLTTVTLINNLESATNYSPEVEECLYQVCLICRPVGNGRIAAYPRTSIVSDDQEEDILNLLYRRHQAYGTGHGCSVRWVAPSHGAVAEIQSETLPWAEVAPITYDLPEHDTVLNLGFLAHPPAADLKPWLQELVRFVDSYEDWIDGLAVTNNDIPDRLVAARDQLLTRLRNAVRRMKTGVRLLEEDAVVRQAFCLANLVMLQQMAHGAADYAGTRRQAEEKAYVAPTQLPDQNWRPFQLAFQLLTLSSVAHPDDPDRNVVDLIWFPTGGGKTEAYLAVTAFLIFYRRLAHRETGYGTAVIMRYTLRLLTAQQFRRAAALVCACELIRQAQPARFGADPITIGLWVGGSATPNHYDEAVKIYDELLIEEAPQSPFQIDQCPWCGTELVPTRRGNRRLYGIHATDHEFWLYCPTTSCPFHERLPVLVVDDQLYDAPPTILLATVDKFARLPWEERVGRFFGDRLRRTPELIIQDELHLISGPLGTIVGLYETAIGMLASSGGIAPKILASTATIRRADQQCLGLYGRPVELFPPSGLDAQDSYFARYDHSKRGRMYLGIMGPGHTASTAMVRTMAALLQAPVDLKLKDDELDAYWTLVAYHNSLRELGKTLTFSSDDVPARIRVIAADQAAQRELNADNVVELTSNIDAAHLTGMLKRLDRRVGQLEAISLLVCSNMLSVGVDVQRLGLMLVNGQPKSTSEYIQATSCVGRSQVPGLIVCLYSPSKPRDRSHYENFAAYHGALYRQVEPTSVTPFAKPARDRALHAVLVSLVRHSGGLPADRDAAKFTNQLPALGAIVAGICSHIEHIDPREALAATEQLRQLIMEWDERAHDNSLLRYDSTARQHEVLLRNMGQTNKQGWDTLQSMRNVDRDCLISIIGA